MFAGASPTVSSPDSCAGALHEPNASGGPCMRSGDVHCPYAGTSETRTGVAPFGRGYGVGRACQSEPASEISRVSVRRTTPVPSWLMTNRSYLPGSVNEYSMYFV